ELLDGGVLRAGAQLQARRVAALLSLRRLAHGVRELRRRKPEAWPAKAGAGHAVSALRHVAAHGAPGLPERCPVVALGELQQPGRLRRIALRGAHHALSALRKDR